MDFVTVQVLEVASMRFHIYGVLCFLSWTILTVSMTDSTIRSLRQESRDIFYHGFNNYMRNAFPEDELKPLSCKPLTRDDQNPHRVEINDVLGNYSLTLIDSLSTLAILASTPDERDGGNNSLTDFQNGIALLVEHYGDGTAGSSGLGRRGRGFDVDSKVQVFETVIRGLGGLLSAHLFAIGELPIRGYSPRSMAGNSTDGILWKNGLHYDGQLLRLAHDLGKRLLPAFQTATGLPYPRVNLRTGIPFYNNAPVNGDSEYGVCHTAEQGQGEITETCSAGAGSLVLEMTTLSRLTDDDRFEKLATRAFWAVWSRRSNAGLIGAGIDAETGDWIGRYTGIGAGVDSFFEYAFKSYILLSGLPQHKEFNGSDVSDKFLSTWRAAHESIRRHIYRGSPAKHYVQADLYNGALRAFWIDSLSAFYPGLLTIAGELEEAIEAHFLYAALWTRYSALPERWSLFDGDVEGGLKWWGGRPEFIESTWYLYRATQDPWYLHVGEMTLRDIKRRCWTKCGWAGLEDVETGVQNDRMESFFLGETAKYLFLLFDPAHPLNSLDAPYVFTTEGHPLTIPRQRKNVDVNREGSTKALYGSSSDSLAPSPGVCPLPPSHVPLSFSAITSRTDLFHAASLARLHTVPAVQRKNKSILRNVTALPMGKSPDGRPSLSSHAFFPWTLPTHLIPLNGTCSRVASRTTLDLTFPILANALTNVDPIERFSDGVLVKSVSGLRLGLIRESGAEVKGNMGAQEIYRISSVSNNPLGRDEQVFVARNLLGDISTIDPYFSRTRDVEMLDIVVHKQNDRNQATGHSSRTVVPPKDRRDIAKIKTAEPVSTTNGNARARLLLQGLLSKLEEPTPDQEGFVSGGRILMPAAVSTGSGAAPLPDIDDLTNEKKPSLLWTSIYFTDELCSKRLPRHVPRVYQVLVVKRGGCSFGRKLRNIPSFAPSPGALQLVIVVSFPEHDDLLVGQQGSQWATLKLPREGERPKDVLTIRPLLDKIQYTPGGMPRPHPIPLVMIGGGKESYEILKNARAVGIRRRWHFYSQGLKISNLAVV